MYTKNNNKKADYCINWQFKLGTLNGELIRKIINLEEISKISCKKPRYISLNANYWQCSITK